MECNLFLSVMIYYARIDVEWKFALDIYVRVKLGFREAFTRVIRDFGVRFRGYQLPLVLLFRWDLEGSIYTYAVVYVVLARYATTTCFVQRDGIC